METNGWMDDGAEFLRRFVALPKRYAGTELLIEFTHDGRFTAASAAECHALALPIGETLIQSHSHVEPGEMRLELYASGPTAEKVLSLAKGTRIHAKAITVFGVGAECEGIVAVEVVRMFAGLRILELCPG